MALCLAILPSSIKAPHCFLSAAVVSDIYRGSREQWWGKSMQCLQKRIWRAVSLGEHKAYESAPFCSVSVVWWGGASYLMCYLSIHRSRGVRVCGHSVVTDKHKGGILAVRDWTNLQSPEYSSLSLLLQLLYVTSSFFSSELLFSTPFVCFFCSLPSSSFNYKFGLQEHFAVGILNLKVSFHFGRELSQIS